jgi:hypothetical protein
MRVVLPVSERVPPLTLRAITRGRKLRSAVLLVAGTWGSRTQVKSSERYLRNRWARVAWGRAGSSAAGQSCWMSAS